MACALCGSKQYRVVYPSTFRADHHLNTAIFSARRIPDRIHGTLVECRRCHLVRTLEIISLKQLQQLYQDSHFTYSHLTDNLRQTYTKILETTLPLLGSKNSFLDIGCGNGFVLEAAQKLGFEKTAGIEPSIDAAKQAKPGIRKRIKVDILRPGLFPAASFDLITAFQVFDHIPNPNSFLKLCHRLLNRTGLLLMNHDVNALSARILKERSPIYDIEHSFLYNQATIRHMLEKNNFQVQKIYSPTAIFSLGYFLRLLPLPLWFKQWLETANDKLLDVKIKIHPGNLCAIARKSNSIESS